jgi:hypothetical protein
MADDEIERLLREIDAANTSASTPATPAKKPAEVAPAEGSSGGGRVAFAVGAAAVTGVGAWLFGVFTPWTDALDMGFAAATAAFLTGLVAGPPRWFSS